ncbi:pyridoxal phosphate-dependent aminotransferase [Saccharothrix stipae]
MSPRSTPVPTVPPPRLPLFVPPEPGAFDDGWLRLSLSESAFGCSPAARLAAEAALADAERYPDADASSLARAVARVHGVTPHHVVVGNGVDELLLLSALALSTPDAGGVVSGQTYAGHANAVGAARSPLTTVPLAAGRVDVERVVAAAAPGVVVYVCNPHNPTGSALAAAELRAVVEGVASAGAVLVLDEAYIEYAGPDRASSGVRYVRQGLPVVVLRTFSKIHGLAGLRCGYSVTTPSLARELRRLKNVLVFNVNRVALAAAEASLGDPAFTEAVARGTRAVLAGFRRAVNETGWADALPSETNFVLVHSPLPAEDLAAELARRRIAVKPLAALGFPRHIRVAAARDEDMRRMATALHEIADLHRGTAAADRLREARR